MGELMIGMLPVISLGLLIAFAIWFLWPVVVDPLLRATDPGRRVLRRDADQTADVLFDAWAERG